MWGHDHDLTMGTISHSTCWWWCSESILAMQDADMMNVSPDNAGDNLGLMLTNGWRHNYLQCVTQSPISREQAWQHLRSLTTALWKLRRTSPGCSREAFCSVHDIYCQRLPWLKTRQSILGSVCLMKSDERFKIQSFCFRQTFDEWTDTHCDPSSWWSQPGVSTQLGLI